MQAATRRRLRWAIVGATALLGLSLMVGLHHRLGRAPRTLRIATELLSLQQAMARKGNSGFLDGRSALLSASLKRQRFTSVSVLPMMVIASHRIAPFGLVISSELVLLQESDTNTWSVWQNVRVGGTTLKNKVGTLSAPPPTATSQAEAGTATPSP